MGICGGAFWIIQYPCINSNSGTVSLQYFQSLHVSCPLIGIGAISDPSLYTFPWVKFCIVKFQIV